QQLDSGELEASRQELESQIAAVYSDAAEPVGEDDENRWETIITDQQVNSWLATQLAVDFPELAEQGLFEPRVLMQGGAVTIAVRAETKGINAVVSLVVRPFIAEDGWLALELASAKIGSAPLPTAHILDQLDAALGDEGLPGRWGRNDGRPVLLVDFQEQASSPEYVRSLEAVEVRDGEIYIVGQTKSRPSRIATLANRPSEDEPMLTEPGL
ncbi:MAG: hypothetical protein AAGF31_01225, partial [Planctomycetota bacterium]